MAAFNTPQTLQNVFWLHNKCGHCSSISLFYKEIEKDMQKNFPYIRLDIASTWKKKKEEEKGLITDTTIKLEEIKVLNLTVE